MRPAGAIATALALVAALLLPATGHAAAGVSVPAAPQGRVSDYAAVLGAADRATLEAQLLRYEQGGRGDVSAGQPATGAAAGGAPQIAVVIVPSLGGDPVDDAALRFAERWKIGSKNDDGVLLLVSVDDRKVRIEVGYGAEGRLPDALASRIIRELMAPRLHTGDYPAGLRSGVAAIHQALTGQPVTGVDGQTDDGGRPAYSGQGKRWGMGGGMMLLLFLVLLIVGRGRGGGGFLAGMLLGSVFGGRRDGGGGFGGGGGGGGGFSGGGGNFGGGGASGDF